MLNFDVTKKCLVGEGWCPIFAKPQVFSYTLLKRLLLDTCYMHYILILGPWAWNESNSCHPSHPTNHLVCIAFYVCWILFWKHIYWLLYVVSCYNWLQIQEALQRATFDSNSQVGVIFHFMDAVESPPTYFRTNAFTNAYQEIVDAYG